MNLQMHFCLILAASINSASYIHFVLRRITFLKTHQTDDTFRDPSHKLFIAQKNVAEEVQITSAFYSKEIVVVVYLLKEIGLCRNRLFTFVEMNIIVNLSFFVEMNIMVIKETPFKISQTDHYNQL